MVGASGFEPPTSRSRTVRSTKLSHAPTSTISTTLSHALQIVELSLLSLLGLLSSLGSGAIKEVGNQPAKEASDQVGLLVEDVEFLLTQVTLVKPRVE